MKRLLVVLCLCVMLVMSAAAAMAAEGGHAGHVSQGQADAANYVEIAISSADITLPEGSSVVSAQPILLTGITPIASNAKFYVTDATKRPTLLGGFVLDISHIGGETIDITIAKNLGLKSTPAYAWIQDKADGNTYSRYEFSGNAVKNVKLDLHFTAANVVLGNEVAVDSGSSSSGCNAGAASLMLLIGALPLLYFRKK